MSRLSPPETLVAIGERLRRWRVHRGLSQAGLAKKAKMSQGAISAYEGARREMSVSIFQRVAGALGISADVLIHTDPPDKAA